MKRSPKELLLGLSLLLAFLILWGYLCHQAGVL
jgi:hypothetical protein